MKINKIGAIQKEFFIPGLQAMVRDGLYISIEEAKIDLTKLEKHFFSTKKTK